MGEIYHLGMMVLQAVVVIAQIGGSGDYLLQVVAVVAQVGQVDECLNSAYDKRSLVSAPSRLYEISDGSDTC